MMTTTCKVKVQILKVKDEQDKYCVQFKRKAGDALLFYDTAKKYIQAMVRCNTDKIQAEIGETTESQQKD